MADLEKLERTIDRLAQATDENRKEIRAANEAAETREKAQALRDQRHSRRGFWNRVLVVIALVGLVADLGISVVFWRQHVQQDCLNGIRARSAVVAQSDRDNVTNLIISIGSGKIRTEAQFQKALRDFTSVAEANNAQRLEIGTADANACPLF